MTHIIIAFLAMCVGVLVGHWLTRMYDGKPAMREFIESHSRKKHPALTRAKSS